MDRVSRIASWPAVLLSGTAAFFGAFTLLNLAGELVTPHFDATIWWLDVRGVPVSVRALWLSLLGSALLRFAFAGNQSRIERLVSLAVVSPALVLAAANSANCQRLVSLGVLQSGAAISFSLVVTCLLSCVTVVLLVGRSPYRHSRSLFRQKAAVLCVALGCCIGFPLLQIHCFGKTDYRRKADAAVVFGCRVFADGRMSSALEDRVRTGVELYRQGFVRFLVMTGGPGSGDVHETQAMRQYAIEQGVPPERILIDEDGWDTDRSVASTVPLCAKLGLARVLAVSHDFHLPRIKLAYARAGRNVFTVPARQRYRLAARWFLLARETVALWAYYLRPLTHV
jgi:vancomycin permeability regulator SanA